MKMDTVWDESLVHQLKVERNLNFSTISNEEDDFGFSRKKTARDPMSHRIIEKRRRDRMNNCLADLSRLVPTNYLKKGRGRIEKTEIIEMAIKHLKHLQAHPCKDPATCEIAKTTEQDHKRQYRLGFHECLSETVRFLVEIEGLYAGDGICVRLVNHLQKHYDKVEGGLCYTQALGLISPEEKSQSMDIENNHIPHQTEAYADDTQDSLPTEQTICPNSSSEIFSATEQLKQEHETNSNNGNFPENLEYVVSTISTSVKGASQLREMLQNPGLPKEQQGNPVHRAPDLGSVILNSQQYQELSHHASRSEEVYKFKNNIKHRFNADLRHITSSPTESQPDHSSEENNHAHEQQDSDERLIAHNGHHPSFEESELTVKIPLNNQHWETSSSCGSNPSTPPVGRSNGSTSSSGYSTNGDVSSSKVKGYNGHSPAVSPYPRTHNDILTRTAIPPQQLSVPIFALHPKGTFYIPLTMDAGFLAPYFLGMDELAPVLHPVNICVNFSLCQTLKVDKLNGKTFQFRAHFSDKLNAYSERQNY